MPIKNSCHFTLHDFTSEKKNDGILMISHHKIKMIYHKNVGAFSTISQNIDAQFPKIFRSKTFGTLKLLERFMERLFCFSYGVNLFNTLIFFLSVPKVIKI